tara:strand:+ start:11533 stop:12480 length:948 start_codon:yes stop_codon:yes gene_type:complete
MISKILQSNNAILNYHRITQNDNTDKPNDELAVSAKRFKEQLIFLKKNYNLVALDNLINFERTAKPSISITFDDGYKDNLSMALPILNELNIPATVYIITKFYQNDFNVWWMELQDYIWSSSDNIKFIYSEKNFNFSIKNNSEKNKCFFELRKIIKKLDKIEQGKFLEAVTKTNIRKNFENEFLNKDELRLLSSNPLITIGAHSHNHLSLKNLDKNHCTQEIMESKKILEKLINKKIKHFSYPYGTKEDAGEREFKIVEELGFSSAVTTSVGSVTKKKIFNLPRIHINNKANEKILKIKLSPLYQIYKNLQEFIN